MDIKNRRRGKAFERAVWVKGLQLALGADEAIIASRGVKDTAHRFSDRLDIRVISSSVFDAIIKRYSDAEHRLTTEQINEMWKTITIDKLNLRVRIETVKSELTRGIGFRAFNIWLDEGARLLRLATEREPEAGPITRSAYFCCALIAIGADYLGMRHSLSDTSARREYFRQGMLFGHSDSNATQTYLDFAENMVNEFLDVSGSSAAQIQTGFSKSLESLPIQGLVEFFSRAQSSSELFRAAVALEDACYSTVVPCPRDLRSMEAKVVIGLISDYSGLSRKDVLGTKENGEPREQNTESNQDQQGKLI